MAKTTQTLQNHICTSNPFLNPAYLCIHICLSTSFRSNSVVCTVFLHLPFAQFLPLRVRFRRSSRPKNHTDTRRESSRLTQSPNRAPLVAVLNSGRGVSAEKLCLAFTTHGAQLVTAQKPPPSCDLDVILCSTSPISQSLSPYMQ